MVKPGASCLRPTARILFTQAGGKDHHMPKKRTKKVNCEPFQTKGNGSGFVALHWDMMDSPAWGKLSANDIQLYLLFRRKHKPDFEYNKPNGSNSNNLTMPKVGRDTGRDNTGRYKDISLRGYGQYMTQAAFDKSIDNLIELGFIRVIKSQQHIRKPTIYGFSEMWKYYGTDIFRITNNDRRPCNRKRSDHAE